MKTFILIATMAAAAIANTLPSQMGVEIARDEAGAITSVREVRRSLLERQQACTGCVHVGGHCVIGEGNCYASENGVCTDCGGDIGTICVDSQGGTCQAP